MNREMRRRLKKQGLTEEQIADSHRRIVNLYARKRLEARMDLIDTKIEKGIPVGDDLKAFYADSLEYHDA